MLTLEQAIEHADAIVAERGADFVYNPNGKGYCTYVPKTDPRSPERMGMGTSAPAEGSTVCGCLVGCIIERAGLMTDEIAGCLLPIGTMVNAGMLRVEPQARTFLTVLQYRQDGGEPWGDALRYAKISVDA